MLAGEKTANGQNYEPFSVRSVEINRLFTDYPWPVSVFVIFGDLRILFNKNNNLVFSYLN